MNSLSAKVEHKTRKQMQKEREKCEKNSVSKCTFLMIRNFLINEVLFKHI